MADKSSELNNPEQSDIIQFVNWRAAPLEIIELAESFGWNMTNKAPTDNQLFAAFDDGKLFLTRDSKTKIFVDFAEGASAHRQKFGGGKNQAIAKAVGLNKIDLAKKSLHVFDATAGMGKDAFVLASLGCNVTLVERQQPIYALLIDGFRRAKTSSHLPWFDERMTVINAPAQQALTDALAEKQLVDVVYLDPMFPHREKSAAVKKDMALFQTFVGTDDDADELLPNAIQLAQKRVVVKRPDYAPFLNNQQPSTQIKTKKNRFDVYVNAAMA
ncbi:ribosomal RNA small subunit methyltransferase J [Psychrosphaera saromensis]|nr:class I SAM-dependent methyltransferase [Psychrosphaera saromensis]GHB71023.1 ribosomal RNA small subunit methyltransferase J [Psychrosphaera saromensis]GLQ13252.1 ribosomal RNA small subunit methyltransferase J [Psychrosphaera saromensis]